MSSFVNYGLPIRFGPPSAIQPFGRSWLPLKQTIFTVQHFVKTSDPGSEKRIPSDRQEKVLYDRNVDILLSCLPSNDTKPPQPSPGTSTEESLRRYYETIRITAGKYLISWPGPDYDDLISWPGPDDCKFNTEIHHQSRRVLSGEDLPLQESIKFFEAVHYRLAVMRTAEFYRRELGLTKFYVELWESEHLDQHPFFNDIMACITKSELLGPLTHWTPYLYLAFLMTLAGYDITQVSRACDWLIEAYQDICIEVERLYVEARVRGELANIREARAKMEIDALKMADKVQFWLHEKILDSGDGVWLS